MEVEGRTSSAEMEVGVIQKGRRGFERVWRRWGRSRFKAWFNQSKPELSNNASYSGLEIRRRTG